jgi:REP element-mobilizing transposase RayT
MGSLQELLDYESYKPPEPGDAPKISVWIHALFTVKTPATGLSGVAREAIERSFRKTAARFGVEMDEVCAIDDHCHALFKMNAAVDLETFVVYLQSESEELLEAKGLSATPTTWEERYAAVSIGANELDKARRHIRSQTRVHGKISYSERYRNFILRYG